jgi:hypothetical protein
MAYWTVQMHPGAKCGKGYQLITKLIDYFIDYISFLSSACCSITSGTARLEQKTIPTRLKLVPSFALETQFFCLAVVFGR